MTESPPWLLERPTPSATLSSASRFSANSATEPCATPPADLPRPTSSHSQRPPPAHQRVVGETSIRHLRMPPEKTPTPSLVSPGCWYRTRSSTRPQGQQSSNFLNGSSPRARRSAPHLPTLHSLRRSSPVN